MKHCIGLLILLFIATACRQEQEKDRRAELNIEGRVSEISVSPDEKIWLVTMMGHTYYTDNIDSNWHYGRANMSMLERISFFNKDTAIMTGFILVDIYENKNNGYSWTKRMTDDISTEIIERKHNGYYLTKNGGKNWELLSFGGEGERIYDVFIGEQGNAWMGGTDENIYFSKDFGQHWEKLNSPYNSLLRMNSFFMLNSMTGISGASGNNIYATSDNWKSSKKIPTPYDQKKYVNSNKYSNDRIDKILIWNNVIVANQGGRVYYTETDSIDWKAFPIKIYDFVLDKDSKKIFAISDSLKIIAFTSPVEFHQLADYRLPSYPVHIQAVNGSLYVLSDDNEVYKINKDGFTHVIPYTTDKRIAEPRLVKQGVKLVWGANGKQLYIADSHKREWYRENVLDFKVRDISLLDDSTAILWDGRDNYSYSLDDHTPKRYYAKAPLQTFLASPIKTFFINSGTGDGAQFDGDDIRYEKINDSVFATTKFSTTSNYRENKTSDFKNKIHSSDLTAVLTGIDSNLSTIPTLKDFRITESDKKNYLKMVDNHGGKRSRYSGRKRKIDKDFYYSVPTMLDTLDDSVIEAVLSQRETSFSTMTTWLSIQVVNQNNDTLSISRSYYVETLPWNLPWRFDYKGQRFTSYNIEFSRLVNSCIPNTFKEKRVFNNSFLIMKIADYLWNEGE